MKELLAIDPGTYKSGVVHYNPEEQKVDWADEIDNFELLLNLRKWTCEEGCELAIENIEGMGFAVGKETFETCIWIGRFIEAWESYAPLSRKAYRISRGDVKIVICGYKTYKDPKTGKRKGVKDPEIRKALIEKFPATGGGKTPAVGTKKKPGPLYGVKGHCWQALAVAVTFLETEKQSTIQG